MRKSSAYEVSQSTVVRGKGAYGEFRFVPAEESITLEYNERYVDTKLYCHEF